MSQLVDTLRRFLLWVSGAPAAELKPRPAQAPPPAAQTAAATVEPAQTAEPAPRLAEGATAGRAPDPLQPLPLTAAQEVPAVPEDVINDATAYGVEIEPVDVPEGATYWQAIRVHHLTPAENHGNHHIYLDALDEAGTRIYGVEARITWDGGEQVVTIDKPPNEPGTNFPMWKWQVCAAEMVGLPSERVTGMHTAHADEPPGNTFFHHSFHIDFQRALKQSQTPSDSIIDGVVVNGAGSTLLLTLDGEIVASRVLDEAGAFSFEDLGPGSYVLAVEGSDIQSQPIELDGSNRVTVNLEVPEAGGGDGKIIARYLLFGPPELSRTVVYLELASDFLAGGHASFGFRTEDAMHAKTVILMGELQDIDVVSEAALAGAGCQVQRVVGTPAEIAAALDDLILNTGPGMVFLPTTPISREEDHGIRNQRLPNG